MKIKYDEVAKKTAILVAGDDSSLRKDAIDAIFAELGIEQDNLDVETTFADQKHPNDWVGAAASVPFMGDRRVVVVRNMGRLDPGKVWEGVRVKAEGHPFIDQLKKLPDTALILMVGDEEAGDLDKAARVESIIKKWHKIVQTGQGAVLSPEVDRDKIVQYLRKLASEKEKNLTAGAATVLADMAGGRFNIAKAELEKAIFYVGDEGTITDKHIREVATPEQEYNVYQLVDAIVAGNSGNALLQLRRLITRKDKIEGHTFARVFPTIIKQFRLIWQAKLCQLDRCAINNPSIKVLDQLPKKPRISDEKEWLQKRYARSASKLNLDQVENVFASLIKADARMKGLKPSYSNSEAVELMILEMTSICAGKS